MPPRSSSFPSLSVISISLTSYNVTCINPSFRGREIGESFFETITHVAETDIFSKTLNNQKKEKALQTNEGLRNDHQILSNFFSSLSGVSATHSLKSKTFIRAAHALQIYTHTHHVLMAGPNAAMLLSSKGAFSAAQFVAGSRRKSSSSKKKSCATRAGFFSKDDDFETSAEAQSSSSSLAGKAVSAVVAAAISLSSAGQAAALSSSQVQLVRFSFSRRCVYFSFFYSSRRKIGSFSLRFGYDDGFHP